MKIRFTEIKEGEKFVHRGKYVNVGDTIDLAKERAENLVARGKAEEVKESPKPKNENNSKE